MLSFPCPSGHKGELVLRDHLSRLAAIVAIAVLVITGCAPGPELAHPAQGQSVEPTPAAPTPTPVTSAPESAPEPTAAETPVPTPTIEPSTPAPSPTPAATRPVDTTPSPSPTTAASPTAGPAILKAGSRGPQVRELQARLRQLDWFVGQVTDLYGRTTTASVEGFQAKRGLPVSGAVDQKTWDTLVSMTKAPTEAELANRPEPGEVILERGARGDQVRELQARLKQLNWFSGNVTDFYGDQTVASVSGFQERRGLVPSGVVDRTTWDRLVGMTRTPTQDELHNVAPTPKAPSNAPQLDPRCMTGRVICIDKSSNMLWWVVDGTVRISFDVRFGTELSPTREGQFQVYWKSRNHVSSLYHTPMPWAMFFSGGQAVHYSADFARRGQVGGSHGCVNVRDKDGIAELYSQVREGDTVIVFRS
ncbi:peptidoglycan-binding protein [Parenemella sanctibonifatiensis]|uniref:Peptidoglycan-binding protein n=1 Tax=Parenemella sanctibonifatiensis TaxID=2016505 RepID=A0A255E1Q2_9ACTN|nr:peptidoglycan-binding protein [Parenemella sanctibonifatiensis]